MQVLADTLPPPDPDPREAGGCKPLLRADTHVWMTATYRTADLPSAPLHHEILKFYQSNDYTFNQKPTLDDHMWKYYRVSYCPDGGAGLGLEGRRACGVLEGNDGGLQS